MSEPGRPPEDDARITRPTLVTPRLRLRPFQMDDATGVERIANDQRIAGTTRLPYPYPEGLAARWIASHEGAFRAGVDATFAIELETALIGAVSLMHIDQANANGELGFWIAPDHWGKGLATEAAQAVVDWGFRERPLHRIYAFYMPHNPASGRVLAKLGLTPEGRLRGHIRKGERYEDLEVVAILRDEWQASRKA